MSLFKKVFAQVLGVGGTKIDTRLAKGSYQPGEAVTGELWIKGGSVDQELEAVFLNIMTKYEVESNDRSYYANATVQTVRIPINRRISVNEEVSIPFSFVLSENAPITLHKSHTWLKTQLAIDEAVDQYDEDELHILPSKGLENVIEVLQEIGFIMRECENKKQLNRIVQEFEFVPYNGTFRGRLDELEVNYLVEANSVTIRLQVDRKARGLSGMFSEALGIDETRTSLTFTKEEILDKSTIKSKLVDTIRRYS